MGTLTGTIMDAESKEPVPFANVSFVRVTREDPEGTPAGGAMAGADGTYSSKVQAGNYNLLFTHLSYSSTSVEGVHVAPGVRVEINAYLSAGVLVIEKVEVTGEAIRTAEGAMLTRLRKEAQVADAITSEQISKTTDGNAAEAIQRVTGVTVVGDRYVFVRGLGERYSQTVINGALVGTPEPNKRVVPLDIFPTGVLDNIVIQKTWTPDMEGEFAGSIVNINTREFARNQFKQSLSLGYHSNSDQDFLGYSGGSLDFLGFDDGTRALPDLVQELASDFVSPSLQTVEQIAEMGRSFRNVWTPQSTGNKPLFGYSALYSRSMKTFGKETGFLASLSLSNRFKTLEKVDNTYKGSGLITGYDVSYSRASVLGGLNGNLTTKLSDRSKLKLDLLYTRSSDDKAQISQGEDTNRATQQRLTLLNYVERGLFNAVVSGDHGTGLLRSSLYWNAGYSDATRNEPDQRQTWYEEKRGEYRLGAGQTHPLQRIFGDSKDYIRSYRVDWTVPMSYENREFSYLKIGGAYRNKDRVSGYRRFGFTSRFAPHGSDVDLTLPPEEQLTDENLANDVYRLEELTRINDSYTASQELRGAYGMVAFPLGSAIKFTGGIRYEKSEQHVEAVKPDCATCVKELIPQEDESWLPSVNLTLNPTRKMNLRFAHSQTINRPELRELSPFDQLNFEENWREVGNIELKTARIRNYDVRWELYPHPNEFASIGLFYKDFTDPIQQFVTTDVGGGFVVTPQNGVEGNLYGWEGDLRLSLVSVWEAFHWMLSLGEVPNWTRRWSLVGNYSRVFSEVTQKIGNRLQTTPFQGQSTYSANAGLFYKHKRWEGSLLYKSFGRRLEAYGVGVQDIYEYPPQSLDFAINYQVSPSLRLKLGAENLLDQTTEFKTGELVTTAFKSGRTIGFQVAHSPGF